MRREGDRQVKVVYNQAGKWSPVVNHGLKGKSRGKGKGGGTLNGMRGGGQKISTGGEKMGG